MIVGELIFCACKNLCCIVYISYSYVYPVEIILRHFKINFAFAQIWKRQGDRGVFLQEGFSKGIASLVFQLPQRSGPPSWSACGLIWVGRDVGRKRREGRWGVQ